MFLFYQDKSERYIKQCGQSPILHCNKMQLVSLQCLPIVDGSAWVSAVLDVHHQNGKTQEPHTHAEADTVHCLVTHKHLTVDIDLQVRNRGAGPVFTEAWDLQRNTGSHFNFTKHLYTYREGHMSRSSTEQELREHLHYSSNY